MSRQLGRIVLWSIVALAITWPLGRHLGTQVVEANIAALGDPWNLAWSLAYQTRAIVGLPHGGIYHPSPHALFYGEAAMGALPLFLPVFLATGNPLLGVNVVFLGGLVLTAWSLQVVVERWTGSSAAGAVSGLAFLASPFAAWSWGPSAVNYVTLWWWPWILACTAEPLRSRRAAVGLGLLVFLQGLSSIYLAAGVAIPLVILGIARLARAGTRRDGAHLLLAASVAAIGWAAAFAPYALVRATEPELGRQTLYPYLPRVPAPVLLFAAGEPSGIAPAALATIVLGAICARRGGACLGRAWRSALFWTAIGLALAVPARFVVAGHLVDSPVGWLAALGFPVHAIRDDGRRGLAALMGLTALTGVAYAELRTWLSQRLGPRRWVILAALTLVLAGGIVDGLRRLPARRGTIAATPGAYPLFDAWTRHRIDSPIMRALAEPGGAVLEVPTAPGPILHGDAMHRAAVHGRPMLNGLDGYWPHDFDRRMALACRLPDPAALDALVRDTGLDVVLVHLEPNPIGRSVGPYACPPRPTGTPRPAEESPFDPTPWEAILRDGRADLEPIVQDGSDVLFRVRH